MHLRRTHTPEVHLGFPVPHVSWRRFTASERRWRMYPRRWTGCRRSQPGSRMRWNSWRRRYTPWDERIRLKCILVFRSYSFPSGASMPPWHPVQLPVHPPQPPQHCPLRSLWSWLRTIKNTAIAKTVNIYYRRYICGCFPEGWTGRAVWRLRRGTNLAEHKFAKNFTTHQMLQKILHVPLIPFVL